MNHQPVSDAAAFLDRADRVPRRAARPRVPLVAVIGWSVLAVHFAGWAAALAFLARPSVARQSVVLLAFASVMLGAATLARRRARRASAIALFAAFLVSTVLVPLPHQYEDVHFMGDGTDFAAHREKFEANVPWAGSRRELHFKAHLGDAMLAGVDRWFGRTADSPAAAYEMLSRFGGVLFALELLAVLIVARWSRRACRFAAIAFAMPLALTFFGYYEVGYLAASIGAFPLLVLAFRRHRPALLHGAGALQGLHSALHGFGLTGIAGGLLAAFAAPRSRWGRSSPAFQFAAFATAFYIGWVVLYVLLFKVSVIADGAATAIGVRGLTAPYYFEQRLVFPLTSLAGLGEVGVTSLATGVPLLVAALAVSRARDPIARMTIAYALPGLIALIMWWPTLGVNRDLDLLLGAFGAISAAAWLLSRRVRTSIAALVLLALTHVYFWSTMNNRALDRIWLPD